jgi:low temperature requirement protein LtrA
MLASRGDAALRRSVLGLAGSTAVGVGLLLLAAFASGGLQLGLWGLALALDAAGPYFFGADGWRLVPGHFAERHGLIVIIALGESIVAIGIGANPSIDAGVVVAAVLGVVVAAALWWVYFDVTAIVAEWRLSQAAEGRERNEMARDSYSYLHFLMVAGIALLALGLKVTIVHISDSLALVPAMALLGGTALYLLAHVAFRLRNVHSLSARRLFCAVVLFALVPLAVTLPALATLGILAALLVLLIAYEALRYADARERVRHQMGRALAPE